MTSLAILLKFVGHWLSGLILAALVVFPFVWSGIIKSVASVAGDIRGS